MLLSSVLVVAMASGKAAVARPAPAALTLDGDLTEWNPGHFSVAAPTEFGAASSFVEAGQVSSDADQSARFYVTFDAQSVIVGALVTDDDVVQQYRNGDMWQGDLFEVFLGRPGGALLHVATNPVGDVHVFSAPDPRTTPFERLIRAAAKVEKTGWVVEVAVPFKAFGASGTEPTLAFNVSMKDADAQQPLAHRVWSGVRHQQRASAATLVLDRSPGPKSAALRCPPPSGRLDVRAPLVVDQGQLRAGAAPVTLRLLNFQSANENWATFWSAFRPDRVRADLDLAKKLGANAIRLFVFDDVFGLEVVHPQMLERLHLVVREAATRGLLTVVTFFPFKKEFRPEWHSRMQAHLEAVVSSFVQDPAIAMWDLMNEPDHMWALYDGGVTPRDVSAWAQLMYAAVRKADPSHLVTVGLAGHFLDHGQTTFDPDQALPFVDVVSIHAYDDTPAETAARLKRARDGLHGPLVLQEFGATSLYATDDEAEGQLRSTCQAAAAAGFSGVGVWELYDHPVGSIAHAAPRWSETVENDFGLVTYDGRVKAQANAFCQCLPAPVLRIGPPLSGAAQK